MNLEQSLDKKYTCKCCEYKTNFPSEWLKHLDSAKHKRNGEKKTTECDLCDYKSSSHWNVKIHKLSQHSTLEEKKQHKYYCEVCDQVFFCKLYYEKHINSVRHKNIIKIQQLTENMNNILRT
jgi:hypothetical protein